MPLRCRQIHAPTGPLPRPALPWALLWALLWALAAGAASAEPDPPPADLPEQTARLQQAATELAAAAARREADEARLAAGLARDEASLRARDIDATMLRAARLALDTARERIDTLTGQAEHQRASLKRLQQAILALDQAPETDPDPRQPAAASAREGSAREASLRPLRDQAQAVQGLIGALDRLLGVNQRLLILEGQRLRLLQARVRLDALGDLGDAQGADAVLGSDPAVRTLEATIRESLRAAAGLSAAASGITGEDADARARRTALETGLEDLAARADLAQNELELLGIRRRLEGLIALREDPSMPASLLSAAVDRLRAMKDQIREYLGELQGARRILATRRALAAGPGQPGDGPAATAGLEAAIARQEQEVFDLLHRASEERARLVAAAALAYRSSLTDRHAVPLTGEEWRRIGAGAAGLPGLLVRELGFMGRDLRTRAAALAPARWPALLGGGLLLVIGAVTAPRVLRRRLAGPAATRRVAVPARALAAALPPAAPVALWAWVGTWLALPPEELMPVLLLLGIWPVSVFVLTLARGALFGPDPAPLPFPARLRFYQRLRWGLVLAAVVAALYVLTRSLPVAPLLSDVLDRLAMIGLLLLAVPAFGLRGLILNLNLRLHPPGETGAAAGTTRHRPRLLGGLSRLIALAMVAAAVLGLLGYANLAWALTSRLGWLALTATLLYVAVVALGDLRDHLAGRLLGELGDFWRRYFLLPAYDAAVLLAWLGAGWGLLRLWGWDTRTPPVRTLLDWATRPLLTSGHLHLSPWDLAVAVLLVAAAVSTGAWVKRVSFQLTFRRVQDRGLRQALATLTQYVVLVCGVLLALKACGLDLTTLVVFTASLGVGIGFGLQNIVNNFISGILLLVERPLRVGDVVTVGTHEGEVTRIGIRSLTVRTFDKQEVFIPNGTVVSGDFINWTRSDDIVRTVLTVGIGYQDDPDQAIALVHGLLAGYEPVLREPAPLVSLWEFADSAVVLRIEYCIHYLGNIGRTAVHSEVNRLIWYGFKAAGISMPFPQRDLHVRMVPDAVPDAPPAAGGNDAAPGISGGMMGTSPPGAREPHVPEPAPRPPLPPAAPAHDPARRAPGRGRDGG